MIAAILGALNAIPELVKVMGSIVEGINKLIQAYEEKKRDDWIETGRKTELALSKASSDEERRKILSDLQAIRNHFPS